MAPPMEAAIPSPSATLMISVGDVETAASNTVEEMVPNCSIESSSNSDPSVSNVNDASFPLVKENKSLEKALISSVSRGESSEPMARLNMTPAGTVIARVDITVISKSVRYFIISSKELVSSSTCGNCFPWRLPFIALPIEVKPNISVFGFGSPKTNSEVEVGVGNFLFNDFILWCIGLNARVTALVDNAIAATSLDLRLLLSYFILET
mmetsp:Transcript_2217/g.3370  ORF Transcript_2217/g.3370 Transcript_2217/m.3370 type:complete len:209 (+) Transcript_2217:1133-1759(+)